MSWRSGRQLHSGSGAQASSWSQTVSGLKQDLKTWASGLSSDRLLAALELLAQPSVYSAVRDSSQLGDDLSFLAQQVIHAVNKAGIGSSQADVSLLGNAAQSAVTFSRLLSDLATSGTPTDASTSGRERSSSSGTARSSSYGSSSNKPLRLGPGAAGLLLPALRTWADMAPYAPDAEGQSIQLAVLQRQALSALAAIAPDCMGQVAEHEQVAVWSLLLSHTQPGAASCPDTQRLALSSCTAACTRNQNTPATSQAAYPAPSRGSQELLEAALSALTHLTAARAAPTANTASSSGMSTTLGSSRVSGSRSSMSRGLVEDATHSRLYLSLLRALTVGVVESKKAWVPHTTALVPGLARMLTYGAKPAAPYTPGAPLMQLQRQPSLGAGAGAIGSSSSSITSGVDADSAQQAGQRTSTGRAGASSYRPPHLRSLAVPSTPTAAAAACGGGVAASGAGALGPSAAAGRTPLQGLQAGRMASAGVSDSEASDSDNDTASAAGGGPPDRHKASRVRLAALACLQAMAKADPRALHAHWQALLPLQAPLLARPLQPHLITVLLHDPQPKVRSMAAATLGVLLEGPAQRSYLTLAEADARAQSMGPGGHASRPPLRGFTTLSLALGQLASCLHTGLLHAVAHERCTTTLSTTLRTLCSLLGAAPYHRLAPGLLSTVVRTLRTRWQALCMEHAHMTVLSGSGADLMPWAGGPGSPSATGPSSPSSPRTRGPGLSVDVSMQQHAESTPGCPCGQSQHQHQQQQQNVVLQSLSPTLSALAPAYLACLAEALNTQQPSADLATYLDTHAWGPGPASRPTTAGPLQASEATPSIISDGSCPRASLMGGSISTVATEGMGAHGPMGQPCLVEELVAAALASGPGAALQRIEALAALRGMAVNYTRCVAQHDDWISGTASDAPDSIPVDSEPITASSGSLWHSVCSALALSLGQRPLPRSPSSTVTSPRASPSHTPRTSATNLLLSAGATISAADSPAPLSGGKGAAHAGVGQPSVKGGGGGVTTAAATTAAGGGGGICGSASTSPEDKAAQMSVRLAADYVAALCTHHGLHVVEGEHGRSQPLLPSMPAHLAASSSSQLQGGGSSSSSQGGVRQGGQAAVSWVVVEQRLGQLWYALLQALVPAATSHSSYMVRAAAYTACGGLPPVLLSALQGDMQLQGLLQLLADAACSDPAPAARAAALKALGSLVAAGVLAAELQPAALTRPAADSGLQAATVALAAGCADGVLSVRTAAAAALACVCEALRGPDGSADPSAAGPTLTGSTGASQGSKGASSTGIPSSSSHCCGSGGSAALQHAAPHLPWLAATAVSASHDVDKVRANGVRALGALLACLYPHIHVVIGLGSTSLPVGAANVNAGNSITSGSGTDNSSSSSSSRQSFSVPGVVEQWACDAFTALQSCLTSGSPKVQWNACYAAQGMLRNTRLSAAPAIAARVSQLLLLLAMLVKDCANFKTRTQAAAALACLSSREAYGDVYMDTLAVVVRAAEALQGPAGDSGAVSASTATNPAISAPFSVSSAAGGALTGSGEVSRTAGGSVKGGGVGSGKGGGGSGDACAAEGADADEESSKFPNYKYLAGLQSQLQHTTLHLLALAGPGDAPRARDLLTKRCCATSALLAAHLEGQLLALLQPHWHAWQQHAAAHAQDQQNHPQQYQDGAYSSGKRSSSGSVYAAADLPSDPFGCEPAALMQARAAAGRHDSSNSMAQSGGSQGRSPALSRSGSGGGGGAPSSMAASGAVAGGAASGASGALSLSALMAACILQDATVDAVPQGGACSTHGMCMALWQVVRGASNPEDTPNHGVHTNTSSTSAGPSAAGSISGQLQDALAASLVQLQGACRGLQLLLRGQPPAAGSGPMEVQVTVLLGVMDSLLGQQQASGSRQAGAGAGPVTDGWQPEC